MNSGKIASTQVFQENGLIQYRRLILLSMITVILAVLVIACGSAEDGATQAVIAYIQALSNQDSTQLSNLSCSSWEANAVVEMDSLAGVGSKVEDLACQQAGQAEGDVYVACTGYLALDYNGEIQKIDLSTRTYIARQEDGEWRMCGYR